MEAKESEDTFLLPQHFFYTSLLLFFVVSSLDLAATAASETLSRYIYVDKVNF